VLESTSTSTGGAAPTTSSAPPSTGSSDKGLSTGVIVGVAVTVMASVLIAILVAAFFYKRSLAAKKLSPESSGTDFYSGATGEPWPRGSYKSSGFGPIELETRRMLAKPVEMAG
jgi:hypothetical protein